MPKLPSLHPTLQGWLVDGPLAAYVPSYLERLERGRYASRTSQRWLNAVAHFARWMSLCRLPVTKLDESRLDQFLQEHLPHCGCAAPVVRHPHETHAALMPLLAILRQRGVIAELPSASGPIAEELRDSDVDLNVGELTVRCSKFGKTRLVALHPSAVAALCAYRRERAKYVPADPEGPFFIATRGRRLGQPVSDRQAHRVFDQLRRQLGWVPRGGHDAARIHDLRHSFAVRRLLQWHEQGENVHQHMLALSTYLGHAKVSNTYWYLTGVAELLQVVGRRFEHFVDPCQAEEDCDVD